MARFGRSYTPAFTWKGYQAGAAPLSLSADSGSYSFSGTDATLTRIRVTWNPSDKSSSIALSNSNLTATNALATWANVRVNRSHNVGKWYFEAVCPAGGGGAYWGFGWIDGSHLLDGNFIGADASFYGLSLLREAQIIAQGSHIANFAGGTTAIGEHVGLAIDFDAGKAWFRDAAGWEGDPAAGTGNVVGFTPNITLFAAASALDCAVTANFGNSAFAYTVPAGFLAWDEETVRAEAGSYSFSGTAATLTIAAGEAFVLPADAGSYAFAGQTAALERGYVLVAETFIPAGGSPIGLLLTLTGGGGSTYSFSGSPVDLTITTPATLDADSGSFSFAGQDVTLDRTFRVIAAAGAYSFAGQDTTLDRTFKLTAAATNYSFAGQDVTLDRTFKLIPEAGSYSFVGSEASLVHEAAGQTVLGAGPGSFEFSGSDASLEHGRELVPEAGSFSFAGSDAVLVHAALGETILVAEAGSYVFSGSNATLTYTPTEPVAPGYWQDFGASDAEFWVRKWREQAQALKPVPKPTAVYEPTVAMAEAAPTVIARKTVPPPDPEVVEFVDFVRLLEKL